MDNIENDVADDAQSNEGDQSHLSFKAEKKSSEIENKAPEKQRQVRLPLARVKNIMKLDPDCSLISQDAVFLTTKAAEMFIEMLSRELIEVTSQSKRKTVLKRDLEKVIDMASNLCFLDGMMEA